MLNRCPSLLHARTALRAFLLSGKSPPPMPNIVSSQLEEIFAYLYHRRASLRVNVEPMAEHSAETIVPGARKPIQIREDDRQLQCIEVKCFVQYELFFKFAFDFGEKHH